MACRNCAGSVFASFWSLPCNGIADSTPKLAAHQSIEEVKISAISDDEERETARKKKTGRKAEAYTCLWCLYVLHNPARPPLLVCVA